MVSLTMVTTGLIHPLPILLCDASVAMHIIIEDLKSISEVGPSAPNNINNCQVDCWH